jgi:glycosyltransferase involved in cell wall biosynthesis
MALAGLARRPSSAYPFSLSYDLARAAERLDAAVEALRPDAVLLPTSLVHLAPRLTAQGVAVIGDAVDVQSQLSRRLTAYGRRAPWRWLGLFGNHLAIREQERRYLGECSELWATTEGEATILRRLAPRAVVVVAGNTVDGAAVRPAPLRPDGPIGFIGTYSYTPNLDAAEYLADHVMPRVRRALPGARLSLAGAGMPVDVAQRLAARDGIDVLGPVADPIRFVTSCSLMALPIRLRGGVPLKLVEALACGRPVVATPELVAGLALVDGQDLLVANNASGLAASIVRLLTDPDLADRIATHGRDSFDRDLSLDASLGRLRAESLLSNRPSQ